MKTACLFPGQGSQAVGMGADLRRHFASARAVFDRAGERLGRAHMDVMEHGPEDTLRDTRFAQTSLFVVSMAAHAALREIGVRPDVTAGHSVGEYAALCAAGAFDFDTGLSLVKTRGEAMAEAAARVPGAMAALVGLERSVVQTLCDRAGESGVCQPVNFNCPGQIVVAGEVSAVEKVLSLAEQAGAVKSVRLHVSGAFHSSLMSSAAAVMGRSLAGVDLRPPSVPVVMNVNATPTRDPEEIRRNLVAQVDHPVLWEDTMARLIRDGVDRFIETGPGRVLAGLLRRMDRTRRCFSLEDKAGADAVSAALANC